MNNVGEKIRKIRDLKGLSQENMADMMGLSLPTYAEIERDKKDVTLKRLSKIAEQLGVTVNDILNFNDRVTNFFDQCDKPQVNTGPNHNPSQHNYDNRELQHEIEKLQLKLEKLQVEKDKVDMEIRYMREKYEGGT